MKILLAIDESRFSEAATQVVIRQTRPEQTDVHVLHVVPPSDAYPAFSNAVHARDIAAAQQKLLERGKELVSRAAQLLSKRGFNVHTAVENGDPGSLIVAYAAQHNCDLIVVGSHGRKGLDRVLMGSVAEFVAHHASSPVEIVRIPKAKGTKGRSPRSYRGSEA